ncbi:hypothetical protein ACE3L8_10130 [Staphylococcus simulans]|uniref:hypothetical protein n=1 Tax=Staphylococcus simulans TaxID=1286 RepID=UPI003653AA7A
MDIEKELKKTKEISMQYGETKHALGRAIAHKEMFDALATYMVTQLSDDNDVEAFEKFQMMIRDDLEIEKKNVQVQMDKLDELLGKKGDNA